MSFYIKLIAIFVISGCVAIDVAEVPKNINNLFSFEKRSSSVDKNYISEISSNLIVIDRKEEIKFNLIESNDKNYIWGNGEVYFQMLNGKFVKSSGLKNDLEIIFDEKDIPMIFQNNTSVEAYIRFTNPSTNFLKINYEYKYLNLDKVKINYLSEGKNYILIEEKFNVKKIRWKGSNLYLVNKDNEVIYSEQSIDPFSKKIKYFYK